MIPVLFSVGLAAQPVRLALVVTTNEGLGSEEMLRYADSDGGQVAEVLVELGSFRADRVVRVRDATRASLEAGLSEVVVAAAQLGEAGAEVDLFVYYTGHAGEDGLHLAGEAMPLAELKAAARVVPAHRRVFVVDACQSGQLMRSKGAVLTSVGDNPRGFAPPPEEAWITSSGAEENAFEVDKRRGALFTHFFISGARGAADSDDDGQVTLSELYSFTQRQTSAAAARSGVVQRPRWAGEHGDWAVSAPGASSTGIEAVGLVSEPLLVVRRDSQRVAAELPVGSGGRLALPSGRYQLISVNRGRPRMAELVVGKQGWKQVQLEEELVRSAGVRARGGLLIRHTWSVAAGFAGSVGGTPGRSDASGAWIGVDRAIGRGHSLGAVLSGSRQSLENPWVVGKVSAAELRVAWTFDAIEGGVSVGPRVELGGGVLDQQGQRADSGEWGQWFGDASAKTSARMGFGRLEAGGRMTVDLGPVSAHLWLGGGGAVFGDVDRTIRPTASLRLGLGMGG